MHEGVRPLGYGTPEHMQQVFSELEHPLLVSTAGELARPGRWYQATRRWRKISRVTSRLQLALIYIGIVSGWWADMESSPLFALDIGAADPPGEPEEGEDGGPPDEPGFGGDDDGAPKDEPPPDEGKSVAASGKRTVEKKLNSAGTLKLVAKILSERVKISILNYIAYSSAPLEIEFAHLQDAHRTKLGTCNFWTEAATGKRWQYVHDTMSVVFDEAVHRHVGLVKSGIVGCDFDHEHTKHLAAQCLSITAVAAASEYQNVLLSTCNLPYRLAGFLAHDGDTRNATGQFVLEVWAMLQWLSTYHGSTAILHQLQWPETCFIMEIVLAVVEARGQCPRDTLREVTGMFQHRGTECIEQMFNVARRQMSTEAVGRCSPVWQWQRAIESGVSGDFESPPVAVAPQDRGPALPFPEEMFRDDKVEFSMEKTSLSHMMGYVCSDPDNDIVCGVLLSNLLELSGKSFKHLENLFLCRLMLPGTIVVPTGDEAAATSGFYVCTTHEFGAVGWPAVSSIMNGKEVYLLRFEKCLL